jgi:hypothetical protein
MVYQLVPEQSAHVLESAPPLEPRNPIHQLRRHDLMLRNKCQYLVSDSQKRERCSYPHTDTCWAFMVQFLA